MLSIILGLTLILQGGHRFEFVAPASAKEVFVAGTFNNWEFRKNPMARTEGRAWTATIALPTGAYQYKFVVDGDQWHTDPKAPEIDDGFGNKNSLLWIDPGGAPASAKRGDGHITRAGLLHDPALFKYVASDGKSADVAARARKGDVESVSFSIATGDKTTLIKADLASEDSIFEYYRARLPQGRSTYKIVFKDGAVAQEIGPYDFDPAKAKRIVVPDWVQDAVFYQIMPERFVNGDPSNDGKNRSPIDFTGRTDEFLGGDFQGVTERLGYLSDLGVTTLYFTPIFQSVTHHKYDTDDYRRIDRQLGGEEAFRRFLQQAKSRKMRVVLDGVFNHVGIEFSAFKDLLAKQHDLAYKDWFHVKQWPVAVKNPPNYEGWWGIEYMPKLNLANKAAQEHLFDAILHWTKSAGLSGWRLDVANEVPDHFWIEFRKRVKAVNRDAVIIGEIWNDASHWLQGDMFDSVMNYPWRGAVLDFVAHRRIGPAQFDQRIKWSLTNYPKPVVYAMYNMLGSHDTPRFMTECGGDFRKAALGHLIQMTSPGAPALYYGDEIGMTGGATPDNRKLLELNPNAQQKRLFEQVKGMIAIRKSSIALRRGDWRTVYTDDSAIAYVREHGNETALVVVNNGDKPTKVALPEPFGSSKGRFALDPATKIERAGGATIIELPELSGGVWLFQKASPNPRRH